MAYALIAGVDPRFGLYSAIVVTAVASIFGSSSHLINGPTSAISLVVFSALAFFDPENKTELYEAMFLLGVMVGSIQILIAVFRLGRPHPLHLGIGHSVHGGGGAAARGRAGRQCARHTRQGHRGTAGLVPPVADFDQGDPVNLSAVTSAAAPWCSPWSSAGS